MQKLFDINGTKVLLSVNDIDRQGYLKNISERTIVGVDFIVLLYDIADQESFEKLNTWITSIQKNEIDLEVLLLGYNGEPKSEFIRDISYEKGEKLADSKGFFFCEITPENDIDVTKIFGMLAEKLINRINSEEEEEEIHDEEKKSLFSKIFYCFS